MDGLNILEMLKSSSLQLHNASTRKQICIKIILPFFFIFRVVYPARTDGGGYAQVVLASSCTDGLKYNTEKHACV